MLASEDGGGGDHSSEAQEATSEGDSGQRRREAEDGEGGIEREMESTGHKTEEEERE